MQAASRSRPLHHHHRRRPAVHVQAVLQLGRRAVLQGTLCCCCGACARCGPRNAWYDRYFAFNMAYGMAEYEEAVRPVKEALFAQLLAAALPGGARRHQTAPGGASDGELQAPASILEVGIGTGPNLPFYLPALSPAAGSSSSSSSSQAAAATLTGLEPNEAMWPYAEQAAAAAGLAPDQLRLVAGSTEQMPFQDASFDAAVMTLVLCSVPDPGRALAEVLRVLRPGASLVLIEHVIAPQLGLLQLQQRLLDPLQRLLADNCHLTRDTAAAVAASAFVPQPLPPLPLARRPQAAGDGGNDADAGGSSGGGGVLPGGFNGGRDLWRFEVEGMGLIAPHVAGILRKPLAL